MKNTLYLKGAVAALGLSLASAAYAQNVDRVNNNLDRGTLDASTTHQETVSKANKASGLIGMDVRNNQNEKLGDIKDIVLDLHSGKISYAVLSVGGFLGIGDKYVAVPPSAFTFAPDNNSLVLNADKAKIQNAPSFAKDNWPALNSSTWETESAYWLPGNTAQGTVGTTSSETASGTAATSVDRSHSTTTLATDRDTFRGRITSIDPEHRTMTVQGPSGTRNFKLDERANITLKDSRNPRLSDLKVGFPVVVGYKDEAGTYVAHSITRSDAPEVR